MSKNPPWNRDELILSLDLNFRPNPLHIDKTHPEVIKLSETMNKLSVRAFANYHIERIEAHFDELKSVMRK
jgi:5-methylcytosine-specific restriction protein A